MDFQPFPKIARLNRGMVVTEKIDGTNACIPIADATSDCDAPGLEPLAEVGNLWLYAQSRTRHITPENDNYGFARWVQSNAEALAELGPGHHFGEWWGMGIQRGYGLDEKRFSLFNTGRWGEQRNPDSPAPPDCCHVVPVLATAGFSQEVIAIALDGLRREGSQAAPGYANPEGVVVYLSAARTFFKVTLEKDEIPKAVAEREAVAV